MRKVFAAMSTVLILAIVLQFFLAATGAFDTAPREESFAPHRLLGYLILLYAVILTVIAAVARLPGRLIGMTGLVAGLVLLQSAIAGIAMALDGTGGASSTAGELVFGLHAINALAIMAVAGMLVRQARELSRAPGAAAEVAGAPGTTPHS